MKKSVLVICILTLLFASCQKHRPEAIKIELIKKYELASSSLTCDCPLSIDYKDGEYTLSNSDGETEKDLTLDSTGGFIKLQLTNRLFGDKEIKDFESTIVPEIIIDFEEQINQYLKTAEKIRKVDQILNQDFLTTDQIKNLKADLAQKKNFSANANSFFKEYAGLQINIDNQNTSCYFRGQGYIMWLNSDFTKIILFTKELKPGGYILNSDCVIYDSNPKIDLCSIDEDSLKVWENDVRYFKNIIAQKVGRLRNQRTY